MFKIQERKKVLKSEFKESNGVIQYKHFFDFEQANDRLDMKHFTYFLYQMHDLLLKKDKVTIQILGSASSLSPKNYKDNETLARQRAFALQEAFLNYVLQCGFNRDQLDIIAVNSIVQNSESDFSKVQYTLITCY